MPKFKVDFVDAAGKTTTDVIEASTEEEVAATLKESGYLVTKIALHKERKVAKKGKATGGKTFSFGKVKPKILRDFTRNLSILQDAGLPVLRSLVILQQQSQAGRSEKLFNRRMQKLKAVPAYQKRWRRAPTFSRLYVNMIKAGEAGGALETILQRLAEFLERSESLKAKINRR